MHEIRLYGELHRFVPVLAAAKGFRVGEVVVSNIGRGNFGKSKYGVSRLSKGLLDLLTVKFIVGYGQRPQHVLGTGIVVVPARRPGHGLAGSAVDAFAMIDGWDAVHLHETASLYYSLGLFIIGAQFLSVGLLGEMIAAYWVAQIRIPIRLPNTRRRAQRSSQLPTRVTPNASVMNDHDLRRT